MTEQNRSKEMPPKKKNLKKSDLLRMYEEEKMSMQAIADYCEVSVGTVWNYMEKFTIKRRSRIESYLIQLVERKRRRKENGNR